MTEKLTAGQVIDILCGLYDEDWLDFIRIVNYLRQLRRSHYKKFEELTT